MRYLLLICTDESADAAMSPEEGEAQFKEYMKFGEEMGKRGVLTRRRAAAPDHRRHHRARPRRRGPHLRRSVRGDQGADRRLLRGRLQGPRRGDRGRVEDPRRAQRFDRSEADLGDVTSAAEVEVALRAAFREEWGRVVATLIRVTGDWDLAEECAQDAFALALETWPRDGVPRSPGAWLTTTARNRARDRLRRAAVGAAKLQEVAVLSSGGEPRDPHDEADDSGVADDRLRLIFTCCHPALVDRRAGRADVAHARGSHDARDRARVPRSRSRRWRSGSCAPSARSATRGSRTASRPRTCCPSGRARCSPSSTCCSTRATPRPRVPTSSAAACARRRFASRARSTQLMPDEPEAARAARAAAAAATRAATRASTTRATSCRSTRRIALAGTPTRSPRGSRVLDAALRRGEPGPYQVQAAIAACHATAATRRGDRLARDRGAVPRVGAHGADAGRRAEPRGRGRDGRRARRRPARSSTRSPPTAALRSYHLLPATRADLLRRLGRRDEAAVEYEHALALTSSETERRYLAQRLAEVGRG